MLWCMIECTGNYFLIPSIYIYYLDIVDWILVMKSLLSSFLLEHQVKPLNHSHGLPPPGKKGRPYICSCMIYARPTNGAKLIMKKWIEEMQMQPWTRAKKSNDQPAFNWALNKTVEQVCCFLFISFSTSTLQHLLQETSFVLEYPVAFSLHDL